MRLFRRDGLRVREISQLELLQQMAAARLADPTAPDFDVAGRVGPLVREDRLTIHERDLALGLVQPWMLEGRQDV